MNYFHNFLLSGTIAVIEIGEDLSNWFLFLMPSPVLLTVVIIHLISIVIIAISNRQYSGYTN